MRLRRAHTVEETRAQWRLHPGAEADPPLVPCQSPLNSVAHGMLRYVHW